MGSKRVAGELPRHAAAEPRDADAVARQPLAVATTHQPTLWPAPPPAG